MTIKDSIILKLFDKYLPDEHVRNILDADFDENGITYREEKVEESEILFESTGEMLKRYASAFLKGAEINGNEEINSDNDLASDLLLKVLGGKNDVES